GPDAGRRRGRRRGARGAGARGPDRPGAAPGPGGPGPRIRRAIAGPPDGRRRLRPGPAGDGALGDAGVAGHQRARGRGGGGGRRHDRRGRRHPGPLGARPDHAVHRLHGQPEPLPVRDPAGGAVPAGARRAGRGAAVGRPDPLDHRGPDHPQRAAVAAYPAVHRGRDRRRGRPLAALPPAPAAAPGTGDDHRDDPAGTARDLPRVRVVVPGARAAGPPGLARQHARRQPARDLRRGVVDGALPRPGHLRPRRLGRHPRRVATRPYPAALAIGAATMTGTKTSHAVTTTAATGPEPGAPALLVGGLSVRFATAGRVVTALLGVDLRLAAGETMVGAGESGSGKSVLAAAVLRNVPVNATARGPVWVRGAELSSLPPAAQRRFRRRHVAYIPQSPATALNPVRRVGSLLMELARARGLTGPAATAALESALAALDLDFHDVARRYPHQLSGG